LQNENDYHQRKLYPLAYDTSRNLEDDIAKYKSLQQGFELGPVSEVIFEMDQEEKE
jgi:hypothetical protein